MFKIKVWLLVVYGVTAYNSNSGTAYKNPTLVVDKLISKEQCVALGKRLAATEGSFFQCTGITKIR